MNDDEDEEVMQGRESFSPDVLTQILLRLPARSVRRFRCVSKLFFSLTSDPSFVYSHALRNTNPLLLIQAQPLYDLTDSIVLYLFDAFSHGVDEIALSPTKTKSFPGNENPNLKLLASCNGFLCFRESAPNSNYYVTNPITKDWVFVPKSDNSEMGSLCGFYLHYPAGDYRLLLTIAGLGFEVCTVAIDSDSWRRIGWPDYNVPSCSIACPVLLHGCLHWMGSKYDAFTSSTTNGIVAFDTQLEEFRQISHPNSTRSINRNHLLEIEGSLGLCQVKEESVMEIW
uniref:F-box domain-containing protein n=1 Tax=Ananas comosus var. bracteatus TaxID=296719 RepID=A0A6V7QQG0_ANACO|nr:unnamed protein product [Ananas comosus var. bracteatus]